MNNTFSLLLYQELPNIHTDPPQFAYNITDSFQFTTQLHGGFGTASANIYGDVIGINRLFDIILGHHAIVVDSFFRVVYEGRVTQLSTVPGTLTVKMTGYYADGKAVVDDRIYVTSSILLSEIIDDSIDLIDSWNGRMAETWPASYDLAVTDPDTGAILAVDFTDLKVVDALERCLVYGYSSTNYATPYVAIYDNRVMYVIVKPSLVTSEPDWVLKAENVHSSPPTYAQDVNEIFNKVYGIYANEGDGESKTTAASDSLSIARFGTREGIVQNGGNPEGLAMGEDLRDYALEEFAWPKISTQMQVEGQIYSWAGKIEENYMIRAGDLVFLDNNDPNAIVFPTSSEQVATKTRMFVVGTSYSAQSQMTSLTIGKTDSDFSVLMSRLGLSGGLK